MLKIVTFNIWGTFGPDPEKRWDYASSYLAKLDCDILCLQEATDLKLLEELAAETQKKILHADWQETGLATLSNLKLEAKDLVTYQAESPLEHYVRKFIWCRFDVQGQKLLVVNTHLSWKPEDNETRTLQAKELADFALKEKLPTLLCGDFNSEVKSEGIEMLNDAGYEDTMKDPELKKRPTWDNQNTLVKSHVIQFHDRRIDLILAGPDTKTFQNAFPLKDCKITLNQPNEAGLYPSDHYGVLSSFGI